MRSPYDCLLPNPLIEKRGKHVLVGGVPSREIAFEELKSNMLNIGPFGQVAEFFGYYATTKILCLFATEEDTNELLDHELLALAASLQRVMVTQDIRFRVLAEDWQRTGRRFAGLVFAHQRRVSFGELVANLELIAKATDAGFWENRIEQLPL